MRQPFHAAEVMRADDHTRWDHACWKMVLVFGLSLVLVGATLTHVRPANADSGLDPDTQAYIDQLDPILGDATSNLSSLQYYLPLGSRHDPTDPTWQLVLDDAQALTSDAEELPALDPPDAYAGTQSRLEKALNAVADHTTAAVNAFGRDNLPAGETALIAVNDATVQLLRALAGLPGRPSNQPPSLGPLSPPALNLSTGDGSAPASPAALGSMLNLDQGLQVSVQSVDFDAWPAIERVNAYNSPPAAGSRMVLIGVSVANDGQEASTIRYADFALTGSSGQTYLPFATDVSCGDVPGQLSARLSPGGSATGSICFQVPAAEGNLLLVANYHLTGTPQYFALQ